MRPPGWGWVSQQEGPPPPILPGGLGEGALGKDRPEEEEKGNRKQSTESGLKFTVFGRKQQLSTGRLGAVEAQSGFLPSGAGASSCGDKTEELTELTIFPSLLGGIRRRVPAHLSVEGGGGSWVGECSR